MAAFIGPRARANPETDYMDDMCVFIKTRPMKHRPEHTFIDVVDEPWVLPWIRRHPNVKLISTSLTGQEYLRKEYGVRPEDVYWIRENHCNYERFVKPITKPRMAGVIGGPNAIQIAQEELQKNLGEFGLGWYRETSYNTREDVIAFYNKIDIQVVWRQWLNFPELNNPLKLVNAMSFGIPTVGFPEVSYVKELGDYYIQVHSLPELYAEVRKLKEDPAYYKHWSERGVAKAEEYHIEHVAKLYLELADALPAVGVKTVIPQAEIIQSGTIGVRARGDLLEKEVLSNGNKLPVYGLSHFRVSPRRSGMGEKMLRSFEDLAARYGKHCIVCFADDGVKDFYLQHGWFLCGKTSSQKNIIASKPLENVTTSDEW